MPAIRRHVLIAASPRSVWRAITTDTGLAAWLAREVRFEGREGGRVVFVTGEVDAPQEARGMVHRWRPISHLEIAFDNVGSFDGKGTHLAFQVTRDGEETRVSIVHSGAALDDEEVRGRLDDAWRHALGTLQEQLDAG